MLIEERRRAILEALRIDGRVLVADLAKRFHTSQVTIRNDLEILHSTGKIHRTHGGAVPAHEGALEDPTLLEKEKLHRKEKVQIAAVAARMVEEGQVVILDSGTTTTATAGTPATGVVSYPTPTGGVNYSVGQRGDNWFRATGFRARAEYTFNAQTFGSFQYLRQVQNTGWDGYVSSVRDASGQIDIQGTMQAVTSVVVSSPRRWGWAGV